MKHSGAIKIISLLTTLFIIISIVILSFGSKYLDSQLLKSNEDATSDIAELVNNNFEITDEEVAYMKSLTFNEMEDDDINKRLMDIGSGVDLKTPIINVYLVAPLDESEVKYTTDESNAEFFGCKAGTPLNAVWLLNGKIGDDGEFLIAESDDIYRYTNMTDDLANGFKNRTPFGTYTTDEWGEVISGYAPVYTTEGNYVGMLGIDTDPDNYRNSVNSVAFIFMALYLLTSIILIALFIIFYLKYVKEKEAKVYFDFYSRMSHDMRTPMNGILGIATLAKTESDIDELHNYFNKVDESGKYLLQLINDTLDVSRISKGKLTLNNKETNLNDVVQNITDMTVPIANAKNIKFSTESVGDYKNEIVLADELRFKQIFMNLINNALKYTPNEGKILFKQEYSRKNEKTLHCKFTVEDSGIGVSEDFIRNSIFLPYSQDSNTIQDQYTGSGLGLYITKSIVDLIGGDIKVKSKPNMGTTFIVTFDLTILESKEEEKKPEISIPENILNGKRILLCEDHPLNSEIASKILKTRGMIVEVAIDGEIGLEMFAHSSQGYYDTILMDINMPIMDGLEATKAIRALKRPDAKTIPIIAMTANAYEKDKQASLDSGMNDHLSKPINTPLLFETLEKFISKNSNN